MNAPAESPVVSETPPPQAVATDPSVNGGVAAAGAPPSKTPPAALVWATLALSGVALVLGVALWQRLDRIQQELVRRAAQVAEDATGARITAEQAQTLTQGLQARLAVAEVKLSEVSLQRSQLEELMLAMSRSRDDTLVLDIESGLRLASQQAELTGSVQPLVSALLAADRRIAKAAQPRLNPVQRAMARDIERIRSAAVTDVPALVQRLDELVRLADDLQLLNAPPRPRASNLSGDSRQSGKAQAREALASQNRGTGDAGVPDTTWGRGWAQVTAWWKGFWARVVQSVSQSAGDLVRVGRIDRPEAALLAPEQAFFLRENLKLKVLNARLGLLSRQLSTSRVDLGAVRLMLVTYFDPVDPLTKQALQILSDVLQASRHVDMPRPEETLTALAAAASGR